jgi:hypothetical protein
VIVLDACGVGIGVQHPGAMSALAWLTGGRDDDLPGDPFL